VVVNGFGRPPKTLLTRIEIIGFMLNGLGRQLKTILVVTRKKCLGRPPKFVLSFLLTGDMCWAAVQI